MFADIDVKTWCLSAEALEACITTRTRAVVAADLYGNLPDVEPIRAIAQRRGTAIIEDAAEAIGSEYKGRKAGSFGCTGVFSFHGSKTLTIGEMGMLVADKWEAYQRRWFLRDHERKPSGNMFCNNGVAHKYEMMSSMQASLGLAQLERVEELTAHKRLMFAW